MARTPRIAPDLLEHRIEELLASGPRLADELAREAGFSLAATRLRLERLLDRQRVHREKVQLGQPRWQYRWHLGPPAAIPDEVPEQAMHEEQDMHEEDLTPSQRTVFDYPAVGRRDPLVAALFGPCQDKGN